MKIAVDNQVSLRTIEELEKNNIEVVYVATNEFDNIWFNNALNLGATIFISPDFDIDRLCEKYNVDYIELPQNMKWRQSTRYILDKIKELK